MNNEIITILTEIRDLLRENLTATNVLAERREKDRKRKRLVRGQTLTEKEEGKEAGEKEKSPLHPPKGKEGEEKGEEKETLNGRAREELFRAFWTAYPTRRRTNRSKCFEKYSRILAQSATPRQLADEIQRGLERMKRHPDWLKDAGEFVPMPMTFLTQERWVVEEPESPQDSVRALADKLMQEMEDPR